MQSANLKHVYASMLLAMLFQLLPWEGLALELRPDFMLLTVIYWLLRAPHLCHIGTAWFAGLLIDLATGGLFGQYALAYAMTAFLAVSYQRRLALFNIWQQTAYVFFLLLLTQTTAMVLKLFGGNDFPGWDYYLHSFSSILLWLVVILSPIGVEAPPHKS
ncbi:MAG: rod shape-determining protein MreD [Betaproteobacteria bacterium HGW-Betaproteobacteria-1]|jgi:rod shape-determining protein MreD|nr:MAG: rod shape-determining protein MreD [Betaproteobacteria bacterium HGW-Betaproteobacteria-1]